MNILTQELTPTTLKNSQFIMNGEMVKAVVDINKNLLAIDAELHADLEKLLLENGSDQFDLWGINLYPDDKLIEFDSMINIRPAQGNRSRNVEDENIRAKIIDVVNNWIEDDWTEY